MGKRSDFQRVERDFYPTPASAVAPLLPHLRLHLRYAEPCAGDRALMDHLPQRCVFASDIEPRAAGIEQRDMFDLQLRDLQGADMIITNPPWNRKFLHPMLDRFSPMIPMWLLFDADWIHTKQSTPYLPHLRKIVSVGRVKWFGNMTGKDNCAWHYFHPEPGPVEFFGRT